MKIMRLVTALLILSSMAPKAWADWVGVGEVETQVQRPGRGPAAGCWIMAAIFAAGALGMYDKSARYEHDAARDMDLAPWALTKESYFSLLNSGRSLQAKSKRWENAAGVLALVSAGFATAGALSISLQGDTVRLRKDVRF